MVFLPEVAHEAANHSWQKYFLQHFHHPNRLYTTFNTMAINNRSTKAEILSAYNAIKVKAETPVITKEAVVNTAKIVCKELAALVSDVYHLGAWTHQHCNRLAAVFREAT